MENDEFKRECVRGDLKQVYQNGKWVNEDDLPQRSKT